MTRLGYRLLDGVLTLVMAICRLLPPYERQQLARDDRGAGGRPHRAAALSARPHASVKWRPKRLGHTRIEFVVTLLVSLGLLAPLIPAVAGSRESPRKQQCRDNPRRLAVGLRIQADRGPYARYRTGTAD